MNKKASRRNAKHSVHSHKSKDDKSKNYKNNSHKTGSIKNAHTIKRTHTAKHTKKITSKVHKQLHKHYAKKFCPNCGNTITDDNTLCKNCRTVDFDFKDIKLLICTKCKSYNYKNKWKRFHDLNHVIKTIATDSIKNKFAYKDLKKEVTEELLSSKAGVHKDFSLDIAVGKEKFELPAVIDVTLCPKCSKEGTKYFEGILQIRNGTKEINDFIKDDLSKQKSKGVHINKVIDTDGTGTNVDYYYTDNRYIKVIAEKLRNHFGAQLKNNAQLFSIDWETSKNLYRVNILVRFPLYHKSDVIKINEQLYKVVSMDEKIHVLNLETNTKTLLPHKDSYDVLKPVEMMLIKKYPEYEVLDPNTYYQARLMNPSDKLQINQKIQVVVDGGEAWMIKE
jgi:NMD protein affecting ribosome stability and mRNA decay